MTTRVPAVIVAAHVIGASVLVAVFSLGGTDGDAEGFVSALGVGAPVLVGGLLLAFAVLHEHRWLTLALGVVLTVISFVFVVLVPLALFTIYVAARHGWWPTSTDEATIGLLAAAGMGAASAVVLFRETPDRWETATSSGYASDIVTTGEALFSIGVVVVAALTALAWSRART